jgi:limonene-1,2-epoxide hydrolase
MSLPPDPKKIVREFHDCINDKDIDGLSRLISDDHRFIDMEEGLDEGRRDVISSWKGLFEIFPDYKNICEKISLDDNLVKIEGHSHCSDKRLCGPTIWTAKVNENKITEWRVYEDNSQNRELLNM